MRSVLATIFAVEKQQVVHILSVCVCVALVVQHAMPMRHIVICGLHCSTVFSHIISLTVRFSKKSY